MASELERFRERLHGKDKEPGKFKIKDWLPIVVASTALIWSILSGYWKDFRTIDDVRVALSYDWPRIEVKDARHVTVYAKQNLTFTNAGTRATAILTAQLLLGMPLRGEQNNCAVFAGFTPNELPYEMEPFVVRPGDILIREVRLSNKQPSPRLDNESVGYDVTIPSFEEGIKFYACLQLHLITPDNYTREVRVPVSVYEYKQDFRGPLNGNGVTFPGSAVSLWQDG